VLSQAYRLRKRQDFALVYQHGASWRGRNLLLRIRRQRALAKLKPPLGKLGGSPLEMQVSPTRIGITVSQKVSKRAVRRNRIKRRLRAACRQLLPQLAPGWDVVITVRASSNALTTAKSQGQKSAKPLPPPPKGVDLPTSSPDPLGCSYKEFLQELRQLLAEAKVLDGH
jgi:ribonuclease P protein component